MESVDIRNVSVSKLIKGSLFVLGNALAVTVNGLDARDSVLGQLLHAGSVEDVSISQFSLVDSTCRELPN